MTGQGPGNPDRSVGLLVGSRVSGEAGIRDAMRRAKPVHARANRFHRIIGEGCATSCVRVKDTEACVETDAGQRDSQLAREDAV